MSAANKAVVFDRIGEMKPKGASANHSDDGLHGQMSERTDCSPDGQQLDCH